MSNERKMTCCESRPLQGSAGQLPSKAGGVSLKGPCAVHFLHRYRCCESGLGSCEPASARIVNGKIALVHVLAAGSHGSKDACIQCAYVKLSASLGWGCNTLAVIRCRSVLSCLRPGAAKSIALFCISVSV